MALAPRGSCLFLSFLSRPAKPGGPVQDRTPRPGASIGTHRGRLDRGHRACCRRRLPVDVYNTGSSPSSLRIKTLPSMHESAGQGPQSLTSVLSPLTLREAGMTPWVEIGPFSYCSHLSSTPTTRSANTPFEKNLSSLGVSHLQDSAAPSARRSGSATPANEGAASLPPSCFEAACVQPRRSSEDGSIATTRWSSSPYPRAALPVVSMSGRHSPPTPSLDANNVG